MSTELQRVGTAQALVPQTVEGAMRIAEIMAKSGMFKDISDASKAFVKIWAGAELGIPPFQALMNINIVRGIPSMSAAQMGSLIKSSGKYDYKVIVKNASECSLDFYQGATLLGNQSLTMSEAKRAGMHQEWSKDKGKMIDKITWSNFPENMLFWRCISNGAKFFTPDIFGGKIYHEGEIPDEQEPNSEGYYEAQPVARKPTKRQVAEQDKHYQETGQVHPEAQVADVVTDDKKIKEIQAKIIPGESPEYFDDLEKEIAFTDSLSVEDRVTLIQLSLEARINTVSEPEQAQYVRSRIAKFMAQLGNVLINELMAKLMDQGEANSVWYDRDKKLFYRKEKEPEQLAEPAELVPVPGIDKPVKNPEVVKGAVDAATQQDNQAATAPAKKAKTSSVSPTARNPVEATSDDLPF